MVMKLIVSGVKIEKSRKGRGRSVKILSRTEVDTIINPTGNYEFVIPEAQRFLNTGGWYSVLLEVKSLLKSNTVAAKPHADNKKIGIKKSKVSMSGWSFLAVDVGLKGKVK